MPNLQLIYFSNALLFQLSEFIVDLFKIQIINK